MVSVQNKQSGFGIVMLLVVIVAVGLVGVAGWFVYQHNLPRTTDASANNTPATNQQSTTTQPAPAVAYLDIKEWSVKLPLSDAIKDAYYTMGGNSGADGLPNTAWLSLSSLNASGCNISTTGPSATASPVGSIIRVLPTDHDPVTGTLYTQLHPNGVTINGYYYAYVVWKNRTCASATTLQSIDSAFGTASKSTVAASVTN